MSTPTGKLPHVVDLAAHAARQVPPAQSQPPAESGNDSAAHSPYAPKPPQERAAVTPRELAQDEADDVLLAYAPKRARSPQSGTVTNSDATLLAAVAKSLDEPTGAPGESASGHTRADAPPLSPAQESGSSLDCAGSPGKRPATGPSPAPSSQPSTQRRQGAPDSSLQSASGGNEKRNQRTGDFPRSAPTADRDIERIEDILRQLKQREAGGKRLPRGPNLPPPGAAGGVLGAREKTADRVGHLRPPEPARLPTPQPVHNMRVLLGVPIACVGAALACYYFVSAPSSQLTPNAQIEPLPLASLASVSAPQSASSRGPRLDREPDWAPRTSAVRSDVSEPTKLPVRDTAREAPIAPQQPANATPEPPPPEEPASTPSSTNTVRALQPDEIRLLVQQGEKFAGDGDIVTARMLFERAAKAGDAAAALALAATYDPVVLARVGVLGMDTDVEKARLWYQKAQSLGSTQAAARLNALATR